MEKEEQIGKQPEPGSQIHKPRIPRVWREFNKWVRQTPGEVRYKGSRTGEWPEGTSQLFTDLYTKTTIQERVLGEVFDGYPSIGEIQARPADYVEKIRMEEARERREQLIVKLGEPQDTSLSLEELEAKHNQIFGSLKEQVKKVLNSLTPRERSVLQDRFGLEDGRQRTKEEFAQQYGCSPDDIEKIETRALRKLRQPSIKPSKTSEQQENLDLEKKFTDIKERIIASMIIKGADQKNPCIVGRDYIEVAKGDLGNNCSHSLILCVDGSWHEEFLSIGKYGYPLNDQSFYILVAIYARLTDPKAIELDNPFVQDQSTEEEQEKLEDELNQYVLQNRDRLAQGFIDHLDSFASDLETPKDK